MLDKLKPSFIEPNTIKSNKLTMKFFGKNEQPNSPATEDTLPILLHACPENFSTIEYYDVIYFN